ncbi:hypothetical protein HDU97_000212 [Phlyctochytrium planicorne]|nr:hypothetical protein HDU97_000212 [Phlyctochytrium planicorne]
MDVQISATLTAISEESAARLSGTKQSRHGSAINLAQTPAPFEINTNPSMAPPPVAYSPARARAASTLPTSATQQQPASPVQGGGSPPVFRRSTSLKVGADSATVSVKTEAVYERSDTSRNEDVIYSYAYDPHHRLQRPMIFEDPNGVGSAVGSPGSGAGLYCLFPLRVPIDVKKARPAENKVRILGITVTIQQSAFTVPLQAATTSTSELCDVEDFDYSNLFEALAEDSYFNPESFPVHRLPHQYRKQSSLKQQIAPKVLRVTLPIYPPLSLEVFLSRTSREENLISVGIKNLVSGVPSSAVTGLKLRKLKVEVVNGVVSDQSQKLPMDLNPFDEATFLFTSTILEDIARNADAGQAYTLSQRQSTVANDDIPSRQPRPLRASQAAKDKFGHATSSLVSITIESTPSISGIRGQIISSKWLYTLDLNPADATSATSPPRPISTSKRAVASTRGVGVEVSFTVIPPVRIREVFTVQVFVVNRSKNELSLSLKVPRKTKKDKSLPSKDFIQSYKMDDKYEAAIMCVENQIDFSNISPGSCETAHFHFIAIKGKFHVVEILQTLSSGSDQENVETKNVIQIHVDEDAAKE